MSLPGRFVSTSAGRVFVHRQGSAATGNPPLVLVHGFLMSHYIFRHLLPGLAARHDVVAIDLPGFGESDRPPPGEYAYDTPAFVRTVVELLDALGLVRVALVGHSMGGGVALSLAARHPERVARLVAICPTVYPLPMPSESRLLLNELVGPFLWQRLLRKADLARVSRGRHVRDAAHMTDAEVDYVWARFNRAGGRAAAYAALLALSKLSNASADPGRVRAPTLLVWPEEDRVVPLAHGKRLVRAVPGARLSVVPAAGHDVTLERPDELLRQILPFLDEDAIDAAARSAQ